MKLYAVFDKQRNQHVRFTPAPIGEESFAKSCTSIAREALSWLDRMQKINEERFTLEVRDYNDAEKARVAKG